MFIFHLSTVYNSNIYKDYHTNLNMSNKMEGLGKMSTIDMSSIVDLVTAFMPIIILFALLGMILGLLKKFGRI